MSVPSAAAARVVFQIHDRAGRRLPWDEFRRLQENGHGEEGDNDMLVDPADLTVRTGWPLYSATGTGDGDPALDWPGRPAALTLAWPTSEGYSNLIVDLPGPGTYDFGVLAAGQVVAAVGRGLRERAAYRPSARFRRQLRVARGRLHEADRATGSRRGALGAQALDAAVHAQTRMLEEYGIQHARRWQGRPRPQWGVTFDDVPDAAALASVRELAGRDGWIRLVFDRERPPRHYRDAVAAAHRAGLRVLGQVLDSSQMAEIGLTEFKARVRTYVRVLRSVDAWEVGNEINGDWLGTDVLAKVAYAAGHVKRHTRARTLLTLYWQLGEDDPAHSMFTWVHDHVSARLMADIDDVGISLYPEDHPMGAAFDRVMRTLHARFPHQRVLISELGYGSPDLGRTWWWGSERQPTGRARRRVATFYQAAVLGYPFSGGGTYWWYYRQEALPENALWRALAALHARVSRPPADGAGQAGSSSAAGLVNR